MPVCGAIAGALAGRAGAKLGHTCLLRVMAKALWQAGKEMKPCKGDMVKAQGVSPGYGRHK